MGRCETVTDDEIATLARELQAKPDPHGLFTPSPWEILTPVSQEYWRVMARQKLRDERRHG